MKNPLLTPPVFICVHLWFLCAGVAAASAQVQQFSPPETDPASPRKSKLKAEQADGEVIRVDLDNDGDADVLETWWNGKRARWIDENDDMKPTDVRGDTSSDAVQIDRDGDGYYDGPEDLNIKWVDDNGDGRPDAQLFAANPKAEAKSVRSGTSHWMVFVDTDQDGVNGYVDWTTFEFNRANWRVPPTTSPAHTIPPPNFSPDYMGDSIFLKEHKPAGAIANPEMNWENPFAFYDTDGDGVTEVSLRLLETPKQTGTDDDPKFTFEGFANEAMGGIDLDNDSQKGNEFDFDMSLRFASAGDGSKGGRIDYRNYRDPHPGMKAPPWVLDARLFRFDNWRKIDHFVYVTHDKCFDEVWKTDWGSCWLVFDEDDDDHRWERVEFQYPTTTPYSTRRWGGTRGNREGAGLHGHPQSDSLGDRGEWDEDNSGKGRLYIGPWDGKIHLHGAEKGAWTVDQHARYWGSSPVLGNSSPDNAPKIGELVQYADTDNNGFFDLITYDYDGDEKVDLSVSLLDFKSEQRPNPDQCELFDPRELKYPGINKLYARISKRSFQDGLAMYRAAWKKGLTNPQIDDYAIATAIGEQYDHGYWLKTLIFRAVDARLIAPNQIAARDQLRRAFFTNDVQGVLVVIDAMDANMIK